MSALQILQNHLEGNGVPRKQIPLTIRLLKTIGDTAKDAALIVLKFEMSIIRI